MRPQSKITCQRLLLTFASRSPDSGLTRLKPWKYAAMTNETPSGPGT